MSLRPFVVAVEPDDLVALDLAVAASRTAELDWLTQARRDEGLHLLRGRALSEARARIRVERARLRAAGELAGTRDLLVGRAVRDELGRREMLGPYEPVRDSDASMPGRRIGTGAHHYGATAPDRTPFSARMAVRLPDDLGEQLVRSCYWVSDPAVQALIAWQELWGDGPEVIMREARRRGGATLLDVILAGFAIRPSADAILQKAELQAKVVTTGDIFRSSIRSLMSPPVSELFR